jgi:hypothetical protein
MANTILNGLSAAVYHSLVLVSASADAALRLRGRAPRQSLTWR